MNQRIGGGRFTTTADPELVAKVLAERVRQADEQAQVTIVSPIMAAELAMSLAKVERDALESEMARLNDAFLRADADYKAKHRHYLAMQRKGKR